MSTPQIIQADRVAATAAYNSPAHIAAILAGKHDNWPIVQACAAYRLQIVAGMQQCGPDGFNGALTQAAEALRYLAENERPSGGSEFPNAECCLQIADELDITRRDLAAPVDTQPDETQVRAERRDRIRGALEATLSCTYDCTRIWSAWRVGTMGEDDFVPALDRLDDLVTEIDLAIAPIPGSTVTERCRACDAEIGSAELCETCADGNDPFFTSRYQQERS